MLGMPRPGVTIALNVLASADLIETKRGTIVIRDRKGLEAASKGAYVPPHG